MTTNEPTPMVYVDCHVCGKKFETARDLGVNLCEKHRGNGVLCEEEASLAYSLARHDGFLVIGRGGGACVVCNINGISILDLVTMLAKMRQAIHEQAKDLDRVFGKNISGAMLQIEQELAQSPPDSYGTASIETVRPEDAS